MTDEHTDTPRASDPGPSAASGNWDAVILAGGGGRRMGAGGMDTGRVGTVDKPGLRVGERTLLEWSVRAARRADALVVVGGQREIDEERAIRWTRESPAGGGPVAALAAGLAVLPASEIVLVLAADLPGIRESTVDRLLASLDDAADGAVLIDGGGRRQWLCGAWRTAALRAALPGNPAGAALRATMGRLVLVDVPASAGEAEDVDTPEDLDRARRGR